ncbi:hypothetical protein JCM3765_003332 [Sporobolomyces pararoseus]
MPSSRRSLSVPPPARQLSSPSTFDDPALHSSQPATPVYGRHTALDFYVPEGISRALRETVGRKSSTTKELTLQMQQVDVGNSARDQPSVVVTTASPSPSRSLLSPFMSFPKVPLDSDLPSFPPPPAPESDDHTSSPPSPIISLHSHSLELYDVVPVNPKALPLPSPPAEGDYIFPDPLGRASLIPSSATSNRHYVEPRAKQLSPDTLSSSPPSSQAPLFFPLSKSPDTYNSEAQPPAPRLEPLRNFAPSPPTGRLSAFTGSPHPVSPNFELEGPMFEKWTPPPFPHPSVTKTSREGGPRYGGVGGRMSGRDAGNGRRGHQSPSPLRGAGTKARDRELEKAKERIRELEKEVEALRRELLESKTRQVMNLSMD